MRIFILMNLFLDEVKDKTLHLQSKLLVESFVATISTIMQDIIKEELIVSLDHHQKLLLT